MQLEIKKYTNDKSKPKIIATYLKLPVEQVLAQDSIIKSMLEDINKRQAEFDLRKKV